MYQHQIDLSGKWQGWKNVSTHKLHESTVYTKRENHEILMMIQNNNMD
jgi:hypothetical protein